MVEAKKNSGEPYDSSAQNGIVIQIRCLNGSKFTARTLPGSTVGEFKDLLAHSCDVPANQQRLVYKGRILKDDQTLESYGLQEEHSVYMVRGFVPDACTNDARPANSGSEGPNNIFPVTLAAGSDEFGVEGGLGESLFAGLDRLSGSTATDLFGAELPSFEELQQILAQNPNMVNGILSMPLSHSLMNHPNVVRNIMMSNPHIREIVDRNPELAHVFNDPRTLQQTMEIARNPQLMREMLRNSDMAMRNIESFPEGFNMLRQVYENIQEPLLNATTTTANRGNPLASNPSGALLEGHVQDQSVTPISGSDTTTRPSAPNTIPLPNPWSHTTGNGDAQNASPRSNLARATGTGGMQDDTPWTRFLRNPAVSQMMQNMRSNPEYMNEVINEVFDSLPDFSELTQGNGYLHSQQPLEELLSPSPGQQQSAQGPDGVGGETGTPKTGSQATNRSNVSPEELYATQLSLLREMGFIDNGENIQALRATSGNIQAAVERLLGNSGW